MAAYSTPLAVSVKSCTTLYASSLSLTTSAMVETNQSYLYGTQMRTMTSALTDVTAVNSVLIFLWHWILVNYQGQSILTTVKSRNVYWSSHSPHLKRTWGADSVKQETTVTSGTVHAQGNQLSSVAPVEPTQSDDAIPFGILYSASLANRRQVWLGLRDASNRFTYKYLLTMLHISLLFLWGSGCSLNRVFLQSPGCPGVYSTDQADRKLTESHLPPSY